MLGGSSNNWKNNFFPLIIRIKIDAIMLKKSRARDFEIIKIIAVPYYLHGIKIKKRHANFNFKVLEFFFHYQTLKKSEYLIAEHISSISLSNGRSSISGALINPIFCAAFAKSGLTLTFFLK